MINAKVDIGPWANKWHSLETQVLSVSEDSLKDVATKLYSKIVDYTPVGNPSLWKSPYIPKNYVPGTLKKSWAVEIEPRQAVISNNQPYAQRVENGWSTQAPYGMMRTAIATFPELLAQAAQRYKF